MLKVSEDIKEDIASKLQAEIDDGKNHYASVTEKAVSDRYDLYFAEPEYYKKKLPRLATRSNLVSTDVQDTIEWAMPSFMKLFLGSEDIISITGETPDDDHSADLMQKLIKFQLTRKNNAFVVFYNWFKDALITGVGIIKCYWDREVREEEKADLLGKEQLDLLKMTDVDIKEVEQVSFDLFKVKYTISKVLKNHPVIENIMASELLHSPKARTLETSPFVAHRKTVTYDYLRRQEQLGLYEKGAVDKAIEFGSGDVEEPELQRKIIGDYPKTTPVDEARTEVDLYECYTSLDINDDGLLERIIVTMCNGTILRIVDNTMGRHPFFVLSPMKDPHKIWPKKAYADLIGQLQDLKTALTRQIMINIALNNESRVVISEEAINIDDYVSGRSVIRKKPGFNMAESVQTLPVQPLAPWTFNFLEYVEGQKENRTGITRYNQGLDASSLNKTATGISAIMNASNQRLELVARMFAETGVRELFRFLIELNQKFIDQETMIRLTNESMPIKADDLTGEFDLIVNAGVGMGTKEMTLMNIQTILTTIMQIAATPYGPTLVSPSNVYNLIKKYIEELGFKNVQDFITDPNMQQMMGGFLGGMPIAGVQGVVPGVSGGSGVGEQGTGGAGIPTGVPGAVQGTNNQSFEAVTGGGGLNPMQGYAPRA